MTMAPSEPALAASNLRRVATCWTTRVYWLRSSSASVNTYGSSSPEQNSSSVHQNALTPLVRPVARGRRGIEPGGAERLRGQAEPGVLVPLFVLEAAVAVVEEQQILAFHGEDERLRV